MRHAIMVLLAALVAACAATNASAVIRYQLTVETEEDARIQGSVFAAGHRWTCQLRHCTGYEIGRIAEGSLLRCRDLAAEVGRIRSFFDGVARLGKRELDECNRAAEVATAPDARVSKRFSLAQQADGFWLHEASGERYRVPQEWILSAEEAAREREAIVSSTAFGSDVQEFALGNDLIALRISSYAIADGSAQAAAGRDVFLVFDDGPRKALLDGGLRLGITRSRVRDGGQWRATSVRFYVGGGRAGTTTALGVLKEQVRCGPRGPEFNAARMQWYELRDRRWVRAEARRYEPESSTRRELPLVDLHKSPVQFVLEICSRATGRP